MGSPAYLLAGTHHEGTRGGEGLRTCMGYAIVSTDDQQTAHLERELGHSQLSVGRVVERSLLDVLLGREADGFFKEVFRQL